MDAQESEWVVAISSRLCVTSSCATAANGAPHPALPRLCAARTRSFIRHLGRQAPTAKRQRFVLSFPGTQRAWQRAICNGSATFPRHRSPPSTRLWTPFSPQPSMTIWQAKPFTTASCSICGGRCICSGRFDDKRSLDDKQALANEQTSQALAQKPESNHQHSKHSKPKAQRFQPTA